VNWESRYHAILRRPAYAKFMEGPHYSYLKLKMPGNNGTTITIHGSFSRSDNYDREFRKIASKFEIKQKVNTLDVLPDRKQPRADDRSSKPDELDDSKKTKKQPVDPVALTEAINTSTDPPLT
jgi:hypothetical protein